MNREQFLDKLFNMFSGSFKTENKQTWWDAYKSVLSEKVDYEKLFDTMLTEYTSKTAPSPAWLKEKSVYKIENQIDAGGIVYENIYATAPNGFVYEFGYNPKETCFAIECENLKKRGFKDFRKERYEV